MKAFITILFSIATFYASSQVILAPMHWKNGKDLFDTLSVAGGFQHQLLGAKSDNGRLEYLEPLVQGAFVVSDSELNAATLVPAIYDLRNGEKWVSDNAGNFTKDTTGSTYFTDYGVRRFLYNPTTQKTFYVKPDSSYSQIGSGNVFNVHADTTINNTYVSNDNSYYYNLGDSSYLDDRDFYNDGTITTPYRVRRYDNAYIDSLFASITPGGGGGGGGTTVNNYYGSKLPYNGDSTYYLGGDTIPHKLPAFTGSTGSLTPLKLTTNGQSGPSTLDTATNTLNVPNYFFAAVSDSNNIDYSLSAMTTIYSEKGPGEYITGGHGVTANPDNFNFPFKQLKSLDISGWNSGDYVSFSNSTTANSTAYTFMRAFIRLKQAVPVIQSLSFQFYLNGTAVSKIISMVNYGLDKSLINKYQNISIPMSAFGFTNNNFDEIRLIFGGGSSPDGLYLDLFQFQNATTTENKYVTDVFRIPGTTTVQKVLGGQNSFAFNDSVGAAVDTTSLSNRINLKLNISDSINTWMPRATPIVNAFNGRAGNVLPQSADYSAYYWGLSGNTYSAGNFLGLTSNNSLRFRSNNTERMIIDSVGGVGVGTSSVSAGYRMELRDGPLMINDTRANNNAGITIIGQGNLFDYGTVGITNPTKTKYSYISLRKDVNALGLGVSADGGNFFTPLTLNLSDGRALFRTGYFNNSDTANKSAALEVRSTTLGFLPPRMSTAQMNAIVSPAGGLIVANTDSLSLFQYWGSWINLRGAGGSGGSSYTDAQARAAISLTTTGTSGAATYNSATGVINIPQYATGSSGAYTFGTGLTNTNGTITSNAITGVVGGQYITGGVNGFDNLTLQSNSNTVKGKIFAGALTIDDGNSRVGIGTTSPSTALFQVGPTASTAFYANTLGQLSVQNNGVFPDNIFYSAIFGKAISITGSNAGFQISDRGTSANLWQHYSNSNIFRIWKSFGTGTSEPLNISSAGNVGIGLAAGTAGATTLDVNGALTLRTLSATPTPASGQAVFWFDGTNVKLSKNVGGTVSTTTVF